MFLMGALAACSLVACNESSSDYAKYSSFAVVHIATTGYYFELDDHDTLYPADISRVPGYSAQEGARVIIAYNLLEDEQKVPGFDYTIALYSVDTTPRWGSTAIVADESQLAAEGDAQVSIFSQALLFSTRETLTIALGFYANDVTKHNFTLVHVEDEAFDPGMTADGYLNLRLCHSFGDDSTTGVSAQGQWVSFRLDEFDELIPGTKGVIVSMKGFDNSQLLHYKVDWSEIE